MSEFDVVVPYHLFSSGEDGRDRRMSGVVEKGFTIHVF